MPCRTTGNSARATGVKTVFRQLRTEPGAVASEPLLGVVTLEEFGLAADPVNRRLLPVRALLKLAG